MLTINNIADQLKKNNEIHLAKAILDNSNLSIKELGVRLATPLTPLVTNQIFDGCFKEEAKSLGYENNLIDKALKSLKKRLVIQTASHSSLSQLPRFLFNHYILSTAMNNQDVLLSGFYTNIPVSNPSYPVSILFSDKNYDASYLFEDAKIVKKMNNQHIDRKRDAPDSFTYKIPLYKNDFKNSSADFLNKDSINFEIIDNLKPNLKEKFQFFYNYSPVKASLLFLAKLESEIFKQDVLYFDINSLTKRLLIKDFKETIFWGDFLWNKRYKEARSKILNSNVPLFHQSNLLQYKDNQSYFPNKDGGLISVSKNLIADSKILLAKLESGQLVPSTFMVMSVLAFQYGIRSLGSFRNIEYTHNFQDFWDKETDVFRELNWQKTASIYNLSTGQFVGHEFDYHSFDYYLGREFSPDSSVLMSDCYLAMSNVFLSGKRAGNLFIKI